MSEMAAAKQRQQAEQHQHDGLAYGPECGECFRVRGHVERCRMHPHCRRAEHRRARQYRTDLPGARHSSLCTETPR